MPRRFFQAMYDFRHDGYFCDTNGAPVGGLIYTWTAAFFFAIKNPALWWKE